VYKNVTVNRYLWIISPPPICPKNEFILSTSISIYKHGQTTHTNTWLQNRESRLTVGFQVFVLLFLHE